LLPHLEIFLKKNVKELAGNKSHVAPVKHHTSVVNRINCQKTVRLVVSLPVQKTVFVGTMIHQNALDVKILCIICKKVVTTIAQLDTPELGTTTQIAFVLKRTMLLLAMV
jgi:hypothetical protein